MGAQGATDRRPTREAVFSSSAERLGRPPRTLTPALKAWSVERCTTFSWSELGCFFGFVYCFCGLCYGLAVLRYGESDIPFGVWLGAAALLQGFFVVGFILARMLSARESRRMLVVLKHGKVCSARVVANRIDESDEEEGPRRILEFDIEGHWSPPIFITTSDNDYADLLVVDTVIEVLYTRRIPHMILPTFEIPAI